MKRILRVIPSAVLVLAACGSEPLLQAGPPAAPGPFDAQLKAAAAEYQSWGRVDDELRWAPFLCRQPFPGVARASASADGATHGQKIYSVFARMHDAYPGAAPANSPVGQTVVKQSFLPELVTDPAVMWNPGSVPSGKIEDDHFYAYAQKDGKLYKAGAQAGLFVMHKLDPATANTDQGWVYGTVATDGSVTSGGRVAACMGCHDKAPFDRLFGLGK